MQWLELGMPVYVCCFNQRAGRTNLTWEGFRMTKPSLYSVNEHLGAYNVKSLRIKLKFTWHLRFMGSPTSAYKYGVFVSRMGIPHQRLNQCFYSRY